MLILCAILIIFSMALSVILTAAMRRWSHNLGLVAHPGERRIHTNATPCGGGVAIFFALWIPIILGIAVCLYFRGRKELPAAFAGLTEHIPGIIEYMSGALTKLPKLIAIAAGGAIIWIVGLVDDRWGLGPWGRLLIQIGVAVMLVFCGISISVFIDSTAVRYTLTILWIVGLINAFNMLDNMDGLSAGVGAIIAAAFCIVSLQTGQYFISAFLCCLIGALLGFLCHNFPPAKIFMGDSGSTIIGYTLAVMAVEFTFLRDHHPYFPIVVPLLLFGMPIFDTITVVWIRIRSGRSPWQGDTNHFSHRLVALGMSRSQAVLVIYLITTTVGLGATVLYYARPGATLVILAQAIAVFAIIGILERAHPKTRQK